MKNKRIFHGPLLGLITGSIAGLIIFFYDLDVAYGRLSWIICLIPLMIISWKTGTVNTVYILTFIYSFLVMLKLIIYPPEELSTVMFNRLLLVGILFIIGFIQIQRKRNENALEALQIEHIKNLEKLEIERAWLDSIMSKMPSGLSIAEAPSGKLVYYNEQAVKLLRHPMLQSEDYKGYSGYGAMHDYKTPFKDEEYPIARALLGETVYGEEMLYRRGDGTWTFFSVNAAPVKNSKGEIIAAISTFDDISENKKMREELENIARFPDENPDPVLRASSDGRTLYANKASKEIILKCYPELNKKVPDDWKEIIKEVLSSGRKIEIEFECKDQTFLLLFVPVQKGFYVNIYGSNITDRKLQQKRLEEALMKLEVSNKELEQFAYMASHDLQEPLRMISSYVDLLEHKYGDLLDEKARSFISFASDGAKRMNSLIKGLLSYSRITTQACKFEMVDLSKVMIDILTDLQLLIKESHALITISDLPQIKGDSLQIHQLFQNLLANAIKFRNVNPPVIMISAEKIMNGWLFSVRDNGIGISTEFYDRIFMLFHRLHEADQYPGTGMGLAICKKIVERHDGKIWVESEMGKGSTFYVSFPD